MSLILVDIDGPLNPFLSPTLHEDGFTHFSIGWASWALNIHTHGQWLKELNESNTIVWCSNWMEESNKVSELFFLPDFDFINFSSPITTPTWKLPDVDKYVSEHPADHIFWLDDELKEDAHQWAAIRGNVTLIPCDPSTGWVEEDFVRIRDHR